MTFIVHDCTLTVLFGAKLAMSIAINTLVANILINGIQGSKCRETQDEIVIFVYIEIQFTIALVSRSDRYGGRKLPNTFKSRVPTFTNHAPTFTNHVPTFTNHAPSNHTRTNIYKPRTYIYKPRTQHLQTNPHYYKRTTSR